MAKQIMIAQGDYGIAFNIELLSENREPIVLLAGDTISGDIQYPSGVCEKIKNEYLTVIDKKNGIVRFMIPEEYTSEDGYYQIFLELTSQSYKVNAKTAIGYFVTPKHGIGNH